MSTSQASGRARSRPNEAQAGVLTATAHLQPLAEALRSHRFAQHNPPRKDGLFQGPHQPRSVPHQLPQPAATSLSSVPTSHPISPQQPPISPHKPD